MRLGFETEKRRQMAPQGPVLNSPERESVRTPLILGTDTD